jgi:signal transduction histidine kinase
LEAIGTLAGGIAHDFNNLLSVIMGGVSLMDYELAADHESRVTLQQIEEASRKAKELANQLITFSKGGLPVMVPGTIGRLVFLSVQSAVGEANIRCQFKLDPALWPVAFDESQIRRVMINIVGNAIDAMPDGGTIVITGSNHILGPDGSQTGLMLPEGPYVRLSVRDEGSGIPDSHLSQIFDPYFSTKGKGTDKGTGLGLAITHSIVTQHGGDIHVEPRNSAGGATFTIYLPACQQSL